MNECVWGTMTGIKYVCLQTKKLKVISEGFFPSLCTLLEGEGLPEPPYWKHKRILECQINVF